MQSIFRSQAAPPWEVLCASATPTARLRPFGFVPQGDSHEQQP